MLRSLCALAAALVATAADTFSRPLILVDKSLSAPGTKDILVKDEQFRVKYTIVNNGEGDATDVSLVDAFPEDMFTVVSGSSTLSLARLESKATHVTEIVLVPKVSGIMTVGRAEVSYSYSSEGEAVEAKTASSTPGRVEIYSRSFYDLEAADHSVSSAVAFIVAVASVVGPYVLYKQVEQAGQAKGKKA